MLQGPVLDSTKAADVVVGEGNLRFYWNLFLRDPGKIVAGLRDTCTETARFLVRPRFDVRLSLLQRFSLLSRFAWAELKIPGGTTLVETVWLTYGSSRATSASKTWVEMGCWKGLSTTRLSMLCALYDRRLRVYDTFEGLPESASEAYADMAGATAVQFQEHSYAGSEAEVMRNVAKHGAPQRVSLVKGDIRDTMPDPSLGKIAFGFLDLDLVRSYESAFAGLATSIDKGTVIMTHEAALAPVRALLEDHAFWSRIGCPPPRVTYVYDKYRVFACRGLSLLRW